MSDDLTPNANERPMGAGDDIVMPQFEQFLESREQYIKALESVIEALRLENERNVQSRSQMKESIDEILALQQLAETIAGSTDRTDVVEAFRTIARQVIPVIDSNIFLFDQDHKRLLPLIEKDSERLTNVAAHQLEEGIIDWVLKEMKTVILPDLENEMYDSVRTMFVIVPLVIRKRPLGVAIISTDKQQDSFTGQDLLLLSIVSNQVAVAVENIRVHADFLNAVEDSKRWQSQMIQTSKLAAVGELASGIAHEINNPLQILLGHVQLLAMGKDLPRRVEIVQEQVRRISEIIRRLVEFSRAVSDEVATEAVVINDAISEVLTLVQYQLRTRGIDVVLKFTEDLPAVVANHVYLQQVFLNLIMNAKDSMEDGGSLTIETSVEERHIRVNFIDTGVGINPDVMPLIFNPFFTTKPGGHGMGLGLSLSRNIIRKLRGEIRASSELGKGSVFTVLIPRFIPQEHTKA